MQCGESVPSGSPSSYKFVPKGTPLGFLAEGLASDAASGLPEGYIQSTPLGTNLELEGLPEGTDSPHYTRGFSTDFHSDQISTVNISPRVQCGKTAGKTRVSVT